MITAGIIAGAVIGYSLVGGVVAGFLIDPVDELEDGGVFLEAIFWPVLLAMAPAYLSYRAVTHFRKAR